MVKSADFCFGGITLEEAFALDFSDFDFDVALMDSVQAIERLVDAKLG